MSLCTQFPKLDASEIRIHVPRRRLLSRFWQSLTRNRTSRSASRLPISELAKFDRALARSVADINAWRTVASLILNAPAEKPPEEDMTDKTFSLANVMHVFSDYEARAEKIIELLKVEYTRAEAVFAHAMDHTGTVGKAIDAVEAAVKAFATKYNEPPAPHSEPAPAPQPEPAPVAQPDPAVPAQ